jgi:hypothetical protein
MLQPLEWHNSISISTEICFFFFNRHYLELGRLYQPNSFPKLPLSTTIPPTQKNQRGPGVWCPDIFLYYETFSCFLLQIYALPAQFFSKTSTFYNDTPNSKNQRGPGVWCPDIFLYYETLSCFLLQIYALPTQFFSKTSTFYNDTPNSKYQRGPGVWCPDLVLYYEALSRFLLQIYALVEERNDYSKLYGKCQLLFHVQWASSRSMNHSDPWGPVPSYLSRNPATYLILGGGFHVIIS